jgi:uncharacterized membrane protein YccC
MKDWKTTVAGCVAAGFYAWANAGHLNPKQLAVVVALAVFGYLCPDKPKTV